MTAIDTTIAEYINILKSKDPYEAYKLKQFNVFKITGT